jgi:hypothetical protein
LAFFKSFFAILCKGLRYLSRNGYESMRDNQAFDHEVLSLNELIAVSGEGFEDIGKED